LLSTVGFLIRTIFLRVVFGLLSCSAVLVSRSLLRWLIRLASQVFLEVLPLL
jgi:hypothetical protein